MVAGYVTVGGLVGDLIIVLFSITVLGTGQGAVVIALGREPSLPATQVVTRLNYGRTCLCNATKTVYGAKQQVDDYINFIAASGGSPAGSRTDHLLASSVYGGLDASPKPRDAKKVLE
jgi:hypothetical protein